MAGCYIPIPVMCDGCNKMNRELIYEGTANEVGVPYRLSKPITDYGMLFIEHGNHYTVSGQSSWTRNVMVVLEPTPSSIACEHQSTTVVSGDASNGKVHTTTLALHFDTADTFTIDAIGMHLSADDVRVSRIYGIK